MHSRPGHQRRSRGASRRGEGGAGREEVTRPGEGVGETGRLENFPEQSPRPPAPARGGRGGRARARTHSQPAFRQGHGKGGGTIGKARPEGEQVGGS